MARIEAILRATRQTVTKEMAATNNLGMGRAGESIARVIEHDQGFASECFLGLQVAVGTFNKLTMTPESERLFPATAKVKAKIEWLPTPEQILRDVDHGRGKSPWTEYMNQALVGIQDKVASDDLRWYKTKTNPKALAAGAVLHEFEEKMSKFLENQKEQSFELDEVVDMILEMTLLKGSPKDPFYRWICGPIANESYGGLDWANGYEKISPDLRRQHGLK